MSHQHQHSANDRKQPVEVPRRLSYLFPELSLEPIELERIGPELGSRGAFFPKDAAFQKMFKKNIILNFSNFVGGFPVREG